MIGTLSERDGFSATRELRVFDMDSCYKFYVSSGKFDEEVSWELIGEDGEQWAAGGAGTTVGFCAPTHNPTVVPTMSQQPTYPVTPVPTTAVPDDCITLVLGDDYGDGWNGAEWTWMEVFNGTMGAEISRGTLEWGLHKEETLCMWWDESSCYTLEVSGGFWATEVSSEVGGGGSGWSWSWS